MSWRVAVTRDEAADGPLSAALRALDLEPVACQVMQELPPTDPRALDAAAKALQSYHWAIFASRRAVDALARARHQHGAWPAGLLTAAVGTVTADALIQVCANPPPIVADDSGADALWTVLKSRDWHGVRVLLPVVPGGRQTIIDGLREAGADVTLVEAYRMAPRDSRDIAAAWGTAAPHAAVIASPSTANALIEAVGRDVLQSLTAIVAIGPTTAAAIRAHGLTVEVSPAADFVATAHFVKELSLRAAGRATHADG